MNSLTHILSDILKISDLCGVVNDSSNHNKIVTMASQIRSKLLVAMEHSSSLYESNMQCIANIIALKRDKASFEENSNRQIEVGCVNLTLLMHRIDDDVIF